MLPSQELKRIAQGIGFSAIGVVGNCRFASLPVGPVEDAATLASPESVLGTAKSMIVLGFRIWDSSFNLAAVRSADLGGSNFHQLYAEVAAAKAWEVAHYLWSLGHEAIVTRAVCLKRAAVLAGIGAQGKNTVIVSPRHGESLRFAAVLTAAEFEEDPAFAGDLCGDCSKCIDACPTKALGPRGIDIKRCMVYSVEHPQSADVASDVRAAEARFIKRSTENSFIECTICLSACPVGKRYSETYI
jgi:epoxyqueuosine reductase QueG